MTAIEFAILSPLFFLMLFGIIETSVVFLGDMTLEKSTRDMARQVRVGHVTTSGMSEATFRQELCKRIVMPMRCEGLGIDLRSYSTFAEVAETSTAEPLKTGTSRFEEIRPGAIMALRVAYDWPLNVEVVRMYLANNASGAAHVLRATNVFRVEPFE